MGGDGKQFDELMEGSGWTKKQTPSAVDWLAHSLTGLIVLFLSFFKSHVTLPSISITSVHRVSSTYWKSQVRWLESVWLN